MRLRSNNVYTAPSPSKRSRGANICEDRISNLPDGLIDDILSRLPTEDAMRTSILARSWKYKWTSIHNIDMADRCTDLHGTNYQITSFLNFVHRVLFGTCNSRIRSFRLSCHKEYHYFFLETWIKNVLDRKVQNLKIRARHVTRLDALWCFSGWTLLTELTLWLSCTLKVQASNCFPNLKRLFLRGGDYGSIKLKAEKVPDTGRIVLAFPILEVLDLFQCEWLDVNFVEIHAPELICFKTSCLQEYKSYEIKIIGAKLKKFEILWGSIDDFVLCAPSVTDATLYHRGDKTSVQRLRAHKILKELPYLACLRLSSGSVKALVKSTPGLVLPTFERLKQLKILPCRVEYILELLQVLPPLELLRIQMSTNGNYKGVEPFPPSIVSKLKEVKFLKFTGKNGQYDMVKSVLKNAKNLKKLLVLVNSLSTQIKVNYELSKLMLPKRCVFAVNQYS